MYPLLQYADDIQNTTRFRNFILFFGMPSNLLIVVDGLILVLVSFILKIHPIPLIVPFRVCLSIGSAF